MEKRFKCCACGCWGFDSPKCPECGEEVTLEEVCSLDHCHCSHDIVDGSAVCPECGSFICPICGAHNVEVVSRITGYIQPVNGWNAAKAQEFKDRTRNNIKDGEWEVEPKG